MTNEELLNLALSLSPELKAREKADRAAIIVPATMLVNILKTLRDDSRFQFDMLCSHTAIDWLKDEKIELVYQIYSLANKNYFMVSTYIDRVTKTAPSVSSLWRIAEWQEREVYDLFGVLYENHPDLRRLFLEDDWVGHPLLKDYKDDFLLERPW